MKRESIYSKRGSALFLVVVTGIALVVLTLVIIYFNQGTMINTTPNTSSSIGVSSNGGVIGSYKPNYMFYTVLFIAAVIIIYLLYLSMKSRKRNNIRVVKKKKR